MNFNNLNRELYIKASHYKFSKNPTEFDKGYLKTSDWVNELCYYYISRKKQFDLDCELEFKSLLEVHKRKIKALKPSSYKDGLMKAIDDVESI